MKVSSFWHFQFNFQIQKPKKNEEFKTEKETINFYKNFNKKVKQLKPTQLETIFEDEEAETESSKSKKTCKVKRLLLITDGLNVTKALKEKRAKHLKKHLGGLRKRPKKMALAKFMEFFKNKTSES